VQIWAAVLVGIVVLLLAANVGLSVWQVSGMARKEVDENLRNFDMKFSGVIDKSIGSITQAISMYESRLDALTKSVQAASGRTDLQTEAIRKKAEDFKAAGNEVLTKIAGNSSGGRGSDTPKKVVDTGRNIWQSECLETVDSPASSFARQTASSAGQRGIAPGERTSAPRSGAVAAATLRAN